MFDLAELIGLGVLPNEICAGYSSFGILSQPGFFDYGWDGRA